MTSPRFSHTWRVGRYTACLQIETFKLGGMNHVIVDWQPRIPTRLTDIEQTQYHLGLAAGMRKACEVFGAPAVVVTEADGGAPE